MPNCLHINIVYIAFFQWAVMDIANGVLWIETGILEQSV